jgi:hypothetical protein
MVIQVMKRETGTREGGKSTRDTDSGLKNVIHHWGKSTTDSDSGL